MNIYDVYGFKKNHIVDILRNLQFIFDIDFEGHTSDYFGNYYLAKISNNCKYKLSHNYVMNQWLEEDFKDYEVLLYVDCSPNPDFILRTILNQFEDSWLLTRTEIIPKKFARVYQYNSNQKFELLSEQKI